MLNKLFTVIVFCFGVLIVSGCESKNWFRDRANDYVKAEASAPLKVPADMHTQTFSEEYQIPKD